MLLILISLYSKIITKNVISKWNLNLLCVNMATDAYILSEQKMSSDFRDGVSFFTKMNIFFEI